MTRVEEAAEMKACDGSAAGHLSLVAAVVIAAVVIVAVGAVGPMTLLLMMLVSLP